MRKSVLGIAFTPNVAFVSGYPLPISPKLVSVRYRRPSESCDLSEYTSNEHLDMFENVAVWDYPIFELEENAGNHILSHVSVT